MTISVDPDWWETMFDEVYLLTDARSVCDEKLTCQEVEIICELIPIRSGHRILDLCGGHGRHSIELCARGFTGCTVLDYSSYLVEQARARAEEGNYQIECVRSDARNSSLPSGSFDHVLVMGNSLGYSPDPASDRQILSEANRVLRPGGWLLVDVANGVSVKKSFNPRAWHETRTDIVVCRQRELEGNTVYAREMVLSKQKGLIRDRTYSIRLFEPDTIAALFKESGFSRVKVHTDFSLHRPEGDYGFMDHRMMATGQKP
jgi:D-alanine-D-alanine ligase